MIAEHSPIKSRIIVEKINKDGNSELIGDSKFKEIIDKDKILFLLKLMEMDMYREKKIRELINEK